MSPDPNTIEMIKKDLATFPVIRDNSLNAAILLQQGKAKPAYEKAAPLILLLNYD